MLLKSDLKKNNLNITQAKLARFCMLRIFIVQFVLIILL
jgi:hypothetical protein